MCKHWASGRERMTGCCWRLKLHCSCWGENSIKNPRNSPVLSFCALLTDLILNLQNLQLVIHLFCPLPHPNLFPFQTFRLFHQQIRLTGPSFYSLSQEILGRLSGGQRKRKSKSADVSADASCWWCVRALTFSTHKQATHIHTHTRRGICECPPRRQRHSLAAVILNAAAARGKSAFGYEICWIYNIRECKTGCERANITDVSRMGGNAPVARPSNPPHPRAARHFYSTCAASRLRPSPRQKCQLQILFGFPAVKKTH